MGLMRGGMLKGGLAGAAIAVLGGCAANVIVPAVTSFRVAAGTTAYHAYGDSITAGYTLSSYAQAYPSLVGRDGELEVTGYAISGDQACDVPTRQIFAHRDDPSGGRYPLYTLMIGTNDADVKGQGSYEAVFDLCQQASIGWLALPAELKVLATASGVTTTGAGEIESANGWNAWETQALNASVSFPITTTVAGPVYVWSRIVDGDTGGWTVSVDGVAEGGSLTGTAPAIQTQNGTTDSLAFLRIAGIAAGRHTVTFTQTTGTGTMRIVAVGAPPAGARTLPTVVVGNVPLQELGSGSVCDRYTSVCAHYNVDVAANVAIFAGDGLDVRFADNHAYMKGSPSEMSDALHPNALGQSELRQAFEALL